MSETAISAARESVTEAAASEGPFLSSLNPDSAKRSRLCLPFVPLPGPDPCRQGLLRCRRRDGSRMSPVVVGRRQGRCCVGIRTGYEYKERWL